MTADVANTNGRTGLNNREWNALIGIVTAIVGNALISLALNIQRYAHIRLGQDRLERQRQKSWRRQRRKGRKMPDIRGYGTQVEVAEERALLNSKAPGMDEDDADHRATYHTEEVDEHEEQDEDDERAPLRGSATVRSSSSSTVRPSAKDEEDQVQRKSYLKSPYWWMGIILMTTGEAGNFIAYGFAPASIVSPLGVVALVMNCIIAPLMLKEKFRQRDFWGVLVAIGGAVTVVLSAKMRDPKLGPDDIWVAISRWEFELYLGLTAAAIVVLMWASSRYGHKSVFIDLGLVGLFGGYTALSTKGVASLLTDTIWRAVTFPIFYLLVAVLVITAIFQIRYVNRALQRFDSTRVVPTQFVCFTLSVIVGSAILYREFESATAASVGKFVGGCALTFLGVWLITSGKRDDGPEEQYDEETGEIEGIRLIDEEQADGDNISKTSQDAIPFNPQQASPVPDDATPRAASQMVEATLESHRPQTPQRRVSNNSERSQTGSAGSGISPFSENPWSSSDGGTTVRASTSASTSEPVLPTEARTTWPSTPGQKRLAAYSAAPTPNSIATTTSTPGAPPSRHSISRLLPGPISSPLSSSLSAIVADQLRRGVDVTMTPRSLGGGTGKRSSLRKMRSNILDAEANALQTTTTLDSSTKSGVGDVQVSSEDPKSRTRSVSDALGELFKKSSNSNSNNTTSKTAESSTNVTQETGTGGAHDNTADEE